MKHTEEELHADSRGVYIHSDVLEKNGVMLIARTCNMASDEANAARIVKTWNEYDGLIEIKKLAEKLVANRKRDELHAIDFQRLEQAIEKASKD